MVTDTSNGSAAAGSPALGAEDVAASAAEPRRRGRSGRTRPPEEIERAKKSAALTRDVNRDASIIREAALAALRDSNGKGPAMAEALASHIERQHGVKFARPAIRTMLLRLEKKGVLSSRKVGTAYEWAEGNGRAERAPSRPKSRAAARPVKGAGSTKVKLKGRAGRPREFRGDDAAARLIEGLTMALDAAQQLREQLGAVAEVRAQVQDIIKALRRK